MNNNYDLTIKEREHIILLCQKLGAECKDKGINADDTKELVLTLIKCATEHIIENRKKV
mgnify:FL=1|tara:strand:- start:679 stop:855 length:177 start_codon:yes stop_codon:yes gene_type:complete